MPKSDLPATESHLELDERIRKRAHEIWASHPHRAAEDTSLEDWLRAEREVLGKDRHQPAQDRATTVGDAHRPRRVA